MDRYRIIITRRAAVGIVILHTGWSYEQADTRLAAEEALGRLKRQRCWNSNWIFRLIDIERLCATICEREPARPRDPRPARKRGAGSITVPDSVLAKAREWLSTQGVLAGQAGLGRKITELMADCGSEKPSKSTLRRVAIDLLKE